MREASNSLTGAAHCVGGGCGDGFDAAAVFAHQLLGELHPQAALVDGQPTQTTYLEYTGEQIELFVEGRLAKFHGPAPAEFLLDLLQDDQDRKIVLSAHVGTDLFPSDGTRERLPL